jgi:deoxyribonuclease V
LKMERMGAFCIFKGPGDCDYFMNQRKHKTHIRRHPWNVSPERAREIQQKLCEEVITQDRLGKVRTVAGVDAGFENNSMITRAAVAVLRFPSLELHECAIAQKATSFPYVPGLLSFREVPAVLKVLEKSRQFPDLVFCDGQGVAHPRRFGIASHIGVLTGLATIGVAKTRLVGDHGPVPENKGGWVPLLDKDEVIGAVLRTRSGVKPVYVSIGHRISLDTAIEYVMRCVTRFRLPEPSRWAHRFASTSSGMNARK